jgi:hypothetical protein
MKFIITEIGEEDSYYSKRNMIIGRKLSLLSNHPNSIDKGLQGGFLRASVVFDEDPLGVNNRERFFIAIKLRHVEE